jgi:[methyl-Co(III) methanol-specific corrinoid protein]:coenzyme M methyltransferase
MRDRLLAALDRRDVDRPPCVSPGQTAIVELQKAVNAEWPLAHQDAKLMSRLALASVLMAGQEGTRVPFDTAVDASAFGAGVAMGSQTASPYISEHPLADPGAVEVASVPDPRRDGRAPVVLEAVRSLREQEAPVLCAITAPFTLACFLRGERDTLMDLIVDPDLVHRVAALAERWAIAFAGEAIAAGADVIVVEDTWASGEILAPEHYREHALPGEQALIRSVRELGARTILHHCGHPGINLNHMAESGADGITIHHKVEVNEAIATLAGRSAAVGNLDPRALAIGPPQEIVASSVRCLGEGVGVLAPSCGLDPITPLRNLRCMGEAAIHFMPSSHRVRP